MSPRPRKQTTPTTATEAAVKTSRKKTATTPEQVDTAVAEAPSAATKSNELNILHGDVDTLKAAVSSSNDSWATLATDINRRVADLEGAAAANEQLHVGHQQTEMALASRAAELEEGNKVIITQVREAQAKLVLDSKTIAASIDDVTDLRARVQKAETELTRHRAFHSSHGADALTEAARVEVKKVWLALACSVAVTLGVAMTALARTLA